MPGEFRSFGSRRHQPFFRAERRRKIQRFRSFVQTPCGQQFPVEVRYYRQNRHRLNIGLVAMVNADRHSTRERLRELEEALERSGLAVRSEDERIGIVIPKRNIDTWIAFLHGQVVNEEDAYPHLNKESDCKPYVEEFARRRHEELPNDAPPSLHAACEEQERIWI